MELFIAVIPNLIVKIRGVSKTSANKRIKSDNVRRWIEFGSRLALLIRLPWQTYKNFQ